MVVALKEILGAEALIDPEDYSQHISRFEEEILRQAKEMITVSVVFTYRGLNDTELEQYMEFNRQEYSLKLSRAVFNGAIGAMRGMLEQMVRAAQDTPQ